VCGVERVTGGHYVEDSDALHDVGVVECHPVSAPSTSIVADD
jgi:hypothetical protein